MSPQVTEDPSAAPRARSNIYVFFLASVVAISGFLFGFNTAVINGVLLFLQGQFALTNLQTEAATSALLLGCLLGAAGASLVGDRFGRRKSLVWTAVIFLISTLFTAVANSVLAFSLGRLTGGLAIGISSVLTPVYISEIAPADRRGALVAMHQLAIVIGILISYVVNWSLAGLGAGSWRWMIGIAAIPSVLFFIGLLGVPESPRWLIARGQLDRGYAVLERIFGSKEAEIESARVKSASGSEQGSWREVFSKALRKPLIIALGIAILSQITGINAVLYYGSILIGDHFPGQTKSTALIASVIIGVANLLGTVLAMRYLDRWGRRPMLLTACGGMALSLAVLVWGVGSGDLPSVVLLASVIAYVGSFAFGMGSVLWVLISEIFPNKIRGRAASLATSMLWICTLLVASTFLSVLRVLGVAGTFAVFSVLSAAGFVFVLRYVPETRGKTLEQIQSEWRP